MLVELQIENFAIIDRLELNFTPGLITFTGETGAGKSIIIDAVDTLLGGRAEATMIRSGADRALIEGVFSLPEHSREELLDLLEREDLAEEGDFVTLGREIRRSGRNTARVNGRTVSTAMLTEIGEYLVDIHGQSEHLSLLRVRQHVRLLDSFAHTEALLEAYGEAYRKINEARRELAELRQAEKDAARRADLLTYQIKEIEAAQLETGEDDSLKDERNRLANAEGLASIVLETLQALDEGTPEAPSLADMAGEVVHALHALVRLDESQAELAELAEQVSENVAELGRSLRLYQETIEFNPKRLDQVEERLSLLHNLERKYGGSIEAVLAFAEEARQQLETIEHAGERIEELEAEEDRLLHELGRRGEALFEARQGAAGKLGRSVETELNDLNMNGALFEVSFERKPDPHGAILPSGERVAFHPTGLEQVEFLVAPNPGEGLKPLVKIASGGETSRLMLALKNVLARADHVPTLIFDEIDQGIGGRVGGVVGKKLWALARQHQVLCITHLPQLAVFGEQHYRVQKQVDGGRTHTVVEAIAGEERILELAQMLGGVSEGTRRSALELVKTVEEQAER